MKVIYTSLINRGFSFNPCIIIPIWAKDDSAYLEHEKTHYGRQSVFPVMWVIQYFSDKKFRLQEELLAYKAEIKERMRTERGISIHGYARSLFSLYWGMISYDDAIVEIVSILKELNRGLT